MYKVKQLCYLYMSMDKKNKKNFYILPKNNIYPSNNIVKHKKKNKNI